MICDQAANTAANTPGQLPDVVDPTIQDSGWASGPILQAVLGTLRGRRGAGSGAQGIYQPRDGGHHPARGQIGEFEDPGCLILLRPGVWAVDENKYLVRGGTIPALNGDVE
ncbi:hypothetical protein Esi_0173_0063 [Ectocarpus siliculosus]|uniref:Uncharacterized protein n=1 Tax=Ectocarpus siliculosus TaxID=2880 RepID=D7FN33_ECTSI|nr:hypothetical protein Esi_0173_0063 [Ectocarpus siliculosus]|eukprot:CBJ30097.1 hypothetical protein Esi_0173_0063 [Ectocarpus siliculosus]